MAWLLAALMPGMLMVSAFAMQRLETVMHGDSPSAGQEVALLERAAREAREMAAQRTLDELAGAATTGRFDPMLFIDEPGLPTRPNPLFQPSESANPV